MKFSLAFLLLLTTYVALMLGGYAVWERLGEDGRHSWKGLLVFEYWGLVGMFGFVVLFCMLTEPRISK